MEEKEYELRLRHQAVYWALETYPARFSVGDKPSAEELIEVAKKFETFLRG